MKKLIILLSIVLCVLPLLFSCKKHEGDNMFVSDRFVIVSDESNDCISQIIFCDTETGVLYLYVANGHPAMTVLLDSDGKPLTNKPTKGH